MKKNQEKKYIIEKHPFCDYLNEDTKFLIIGTFPTHRKNWLFDFFYSGEKNNLWKILQDIFKEHFSYHEGEKAKIERIAFLKKSKIGITDMHEICYRCNGYSTDENLSIIKLKDIFTLLDKYRNIEKLILTSRTEVFGALGLLKTYFIQQEKIFPDLKRKNKIIEGVFTHNNKKIDILVPYSPSARVDNISYKELVDMYRYCLSL